MSTTERKLASPGSTSRNGDLSNSVIVSCCGAFHARHAALAAYQAGMLDRYITTQPQYARVPDDLITRIPVIERIHRAGDRFLKVPWWDWNLVKKGIFDRIARSYIKPYHKIFHTFSAFQEQCWQRADEVGAKKIIDWSQAHPGYGRGLMREEYNLLEIDAESYLGKSNVERALDELRQADLVLVPSDFVASTFRRQSKDRLNIRQNPYGIDLGMFRRIEKDDSIFRIIFVGSICIRKGAHYLLEAVKQLKDLTLELILVGTIWSDFRIFMDDYSDYYRYVPAVPHHELYKHYSNSSVFVFPSLLEGMAYVTLEAMACGLPCIVTPNAGSIVRDGKDGFVVPIRDVEALKEKILFFYENEDARVEMGRSAKEHVQQFTWDRYGNQLIQHYRELLD